MIGSWQRWTFSLMLTCLLILSASGQTRKCLTMEMDATLRAAYPTLGDLTEFEGWLQRQPKDGAVSRAVYIIPVIVHVVHDGTPVGVGANLSASRIASQLTVLNEDFRRLLGTPGYNTYPSGADVEIEFCPASISPDGGSLPEPGIDRIDRNQAGFTAPPYSPSSVRGSIMPMTNWDPDQYMNIWLVDMKDDVLGFAQLPNQSTLSDLPANSGPATTDGVAIDPDNFGRGAGASVPYDQGRTTTHEVGHWLGLRHIWGDGNCNVDDYCEDTPSASNPNYGCPTNPSSCSSPDLFQNYMDYTDDACMNVFTQCQRTRMRTVMSIAPRRASLLNSNACLGQLAPVARFGVSQSQVCAGTTVVFDDQSLYSPTSWQWSFSGGIPLSSTQANPAVTYSLPGTYDVSLTATNAQGTQTITQTGYITVVGSSGDVFVEDFENGLNAWQIINPDNDITWELLGVSGNGGSLAPGIKLFLYGASGQRDALISPTIDLSTYHQLSLSFDHAYRPFSSNERDSLRVLASIDGGQTFPFLLYANAQGGSPPFGTGPLNTSSFVPSGASDWCGNGSGASCTSLSSSNLAMLEGQPQVNLRFETVNDFGNNIYVDRIRLNGQCMVSSTEIASPPDPILWEITPNPASDHLRLTWLGENATQVNVSLVDLTGRIIWQAHHELAAKQTQRLPVGHLPRGLYLLHLSRPHASTQFQKVWLR
jgi:PKD repeat protein